MFRIRRIYDDNVPGDRDIIAQVQDILRGQLSVFSEREFASLPEQLRNPSQHRFRAMLFVVDDFRGNVKGAAVLFYVPDLQFCYLDSISAAPSFTSRGIGGALYERVRAEAVLLKSNGLFFECFPDLPELREDPVALRQNMARLRFYERYGAFPIVNTKYETPIKGCGGNAPYLMYDGLGRHEPLRLRLARSFVRAILERKYPDLCPKEYVDMVVRSFKDDPVRLRAPRYTKKEIHRIEIKEGVPLDERIVMVVNDKHAIHHVHERGYIEAPIRITSMLKYLKPMDLFREKEPKGFSINYIKGVHDHRYVDYLRNMCETIPPGKSVYPYVFPLRNNARPPKKLAIRAGYYCIDTFTPINKNVYIAAKRAVDCALTAAEQVLKGVRIAYALVRPPGHHAEKKAFGGFCYFNSNAIAAQYLSKYGKVAILDIDYHHGNGQQNIFYSRSDVLTVSVHVTPRLDYPYFAGFSDERGNGDGEGYNINMTLPENIDGKRYRETLEKAIRTVRKFEPRFLVVALGFDTAKGDPTGSWTLMERDFELNGRMIGDLRLPTLVVQEGGYNNKRLGINARSFFTGLWSAIHIQKNEEKGK